MRKPNFFIVGAPKCGTTALSEYLGNHPNIYVSKPKEPHYFAEDFPEHRLVKSLDQYVELFRRTTREHLAVGEASVWYLYSSGAIKNIFEFNRDVKIIVMLRNPVDMIYSLHSQLVYNFDEDERSFEKAWRLQSPRKRMINIPKTCRAPAILQYIEVASFGFQIEKLLKIYPREQVKVILFDDFKRSTKEVYEDVLDFLNVPIDGKSHFEPVNANKEKRMKWLSRFVQRPPYPLLRKIFTRLENVAIIDKIRKLNIRRKARKPLDPVFRSELIEEFREDVDRLSLILGKDLRDWKC